MLRTFGATVLGGVIFFIAGVYVYRLGIAPQLPHSDSLLRAVAAVLLVGVYTLCGWAAGLLLSLSGAILRKVADLEKRVQEFLAPRMARLIAKIPVGQEDLSIVEFKKLITNESLPQTTEREPSSSKLFSSIKIISRYLMHRVLQAANLIFLSDFCDDLQAQGHTRVNAATVEQFGREKLVSLVLEYLRAPVSLVRIVTLVVAAILLLLPILLRVYS
ncbi:hypothetical protein HUU05_11835 [candidate division KSB1 bacterium]|nr:hypothetical protein [candidate division KSB1 bacterium]